MQSSIALSAIAWWRFCQTRLPLFRAYQLAGNTSLGSGPLLLLLPGLATTNSRRPMTTTHRGRYCIMHIAISSDALTPLCDGNDQYCGPFDEVVCPFGVAGACPVWVGPPQAFDIGAPSAFGRATTRIQLAFGIRISPSLPSAPDC